MYGIQNGDLLQKPLHNYKTTYISTTVTDSHVLAK